ncbi:MAG: hypothetical protein C0598_09550 [Marinilabiliales bacterium]|nr:MAG: hypothetical protein C0598_09550 [Marinilabiliales bacterium]
MRNFAFLFLIVITVFAYSCKKEDKNTSVDYQYGVKMTSDYANVQHLLINLSSSYFKVIYDSVLFEDGHNTIDQAYVVYNTDSLYQLTITYPEWGNDDGYGNWRQGQLRFKADSGFFNTDYPVEVFFAEFNMDKDTIRASSYKYSYLSETDGVSTFNLKVIDGSRSFEDTTGVINFNADFNIKVDLSAYSTYQTPYNLYFSGSINGNCRAENNFSAQLLEDVIYDLNCNWMKQGLVDIVFDGVDYTGTINYSDPELCENWYKLSINEISFPSKIIKPKWSK